MSVVVGRIARAHGIRGEVVVDVRTDSADDRFLVGAILETDPARVGPLVVRNPARRRTFAVLLVVGVVMIAVAFWVMLRALGGPDRA